MQSDYKSRPESKQKKHPDENHLSEYRIAGNNLPLHAGAEPLQFRYARQLRKEMTSAERILWESLRSRRFMKLKFRRQHPLHQFIADFYCHEIRLIVEVDGDYHDDPDVKIYDQERTRELRNMGYRIIRFSNEDVIYDLKGVLCRLRTFITSPQPLSSRRGAFH